MANHFLEKYKNILFPLFLCHLLLSSCFTAEAERTETALDRIDIQRTIYPQEKLHVVTDRDLYIGGDTVWFRVFVVDAATHRQTAMSKYAYVELHNPFGEVQYRVKTIERDGVYTGYIPVDEDIYEGDYTLAAYTMYSENQGKDYFFRKPLRLLAQHSSKYVIDSDFTPTGPGEVNGSFKVRSVNGEKMNYNIMSWTMPGGKSLEMADASKGFSRKFKRAKGENVVLVRFGDYRKYVSIEYPVEKTNIAFYPEGGWLIADNPCTVAFKATDENGKGVDVSGVIRDDAGEKVADFRTVHNGMGSVVFVPEKGRTYTAEYMGPERVSHISDIGSPKVGAASIQYRTSGNRAILSVAGGEGRDLELLVALRGNGVISSPISSATPLSFNKKDMEPGLYQTMLVSRQDSVVMSERLFFIGANRLNDTYSELSSDSTKIRLKTIKGATGGDCSVRIINGRILPGCLDSDIRTQLLLQSELRGRIENPAYYFSESGHEAERNLDLLMMVNGWSRYNLPDAILGRYVEPEIPLEIGEEINGQVRSRWRGNPMEGVTIFAIAPKQDFGTFTETDTDGNFSINGFDFPEGTVFIFRAMNEKGGNEANYDFKEDSFPELDLLRETSASVSAINASELFNDMRWVMLDEIKVQAFNHHDDGSDIYKSLSSYSMNTKDLSARGVSSLEQSLRSIPGMSIVNDRLLYRRKYVAFYIDGTLYEQSAEGSISAPKVSAPGKLPGTFATSRFADSSLANLNPYHSRMVQAGVAPEPNAKKLYMPSINDITQIVPYNDIERVDFIRPENFVIGESYGGGVVMITTKSGNNKSAGLQFDFKDHIPLGYQEYKEYASPMLSVDADDYDLQTQPTLMWIPSVKFDEAGETICLSHEIKPEYRIIIEGISDNGDVISDVLGFRPEVRN